jgi:hypothetical protein
MNRQRAALMILGTTAFIAGVGAVGGCSTQRPVSTIDTVPAPVDNVGREMGPMPLAVGDRVGRSVYMSRPALVARGVVPTNQAFADGNMSQQAPE